jgi:hypothetical protein
VQGLSAHILPSSERAGQRVGLFDRRRVARMGRDCDRQLCALPARLRRQSAAKPSDTVSSDRQGNGSRRTITTMLPVPAGTEGAVSAEGTMAGVAAALGFFLCLPSRTDRCGVRLTVRVRLQGPAGKVESTL